MAIALALAAFGLGVVRSRRAPAVATQGAGGARYAVDSLTPTGDATLLFLDGRPTMPLPDGRRVATTEEGVLRIADARLRLTVVSLPAFRGTIVGAASAGGGDWWISTRDGALQRVDRAGRLLQSDAAPFAATAMWPLPAGGVMTSRSPERFAFAPEPADAPVLVAVDAQRQRWPIGVAVHPLHDLLTSVANAGYVVARGDTAYFAPLGRSELLAIRFDGQPVWRHADSTEIATPDPRFQVDRGAVRVDYQPYNLALTLGPDGMLYRLRAVDSALTSVALDVIEPASGTVRATRSLGGPRVTLAIGRGGQLHLLDLARLLDATAPPDRERLEAFALPTRAGGPPATLAGYAGKVLLLNFWASWCAPCRIEMPALDSLQREHATDDRFALLAINADAARSQADAFLTRHTLQLPVAYGGPGMQARYRYPGLPYTVLVDAQGRVMRRWIGQLQHADLATIRTLIRTEQLRTGAPAPSPGAPAHGHHALARAP